MLAPALRFALLNLPAIQIRALLLQQVHFRPEGFQRLLVDPAPLLLRVPDRLRKTVRLAPFGPELFRDLGLDFGLPLGEHGPGTA